MNEKPEDEKKANIEGEEFKEFASRRPPDPPHDGGSGLRGCGIALGIAALLFLFVVGACFMNV